MPYYAPICVGLNFWGKSTLIRCLWFWEFETVSSMANRETTITAVPEHTVEIITNSGEGAQKCAQIFGQTCAKMGNGVWTVEIIPAEIEPPHHTVTSTSGNIVRFGTDRVTNWGDRSKLAIAFNDQVLLSRHRLDSFDDDCIDPRWICKSDGRNVFEELSFYQSAHRGRNTQGCGQCAAWKEHVCAGSAGGNIPTRPFHY